MHVLTTLRKTRGALLLIFFAALIMPRANATSGELDPGFGTNGLATIDFGEDEGAGSVVAAGAGNVLVGGFDLSNPTSAMTVTKLDANGNLVGAFGNGGKTSVSFDGFPPSSGLLATDGSGNIYLAGSTESFDASSYNFFVAKLDAAGQPVPTFGNGGSVLVHYDDDLIDFCSGLAVDAAGNVYLAGQMSPLMGDSNTYLVVAKLDSSGQPVSDFGNGGLSTLAQPGRSLQAGALLIDSNGDLFFGGTTLSATDQTDRHMFVAKLDNDGALVDTYGSGGIATIDLGYQSSGGPLAFDTQGRLYVSGEAIPAGGTLADFAVTRLDDAGDPDATFGAAGTRLVDLNEGAALAFASVAIDATGDVFLGGIVYYTPGMNGQAVPASIDGGFENVGVAELDANGDIVDSFGNAGVTLITGTTGKIAASALLADDAHHVYLAGEIDYTSPVGDNYADQLVMRLLLTVSDEIFADGFDGAH